MDSGTFGGVGLLLSSPAATRSVPRGRSSGSVNRRHDSHGGHRAYTVNNSQTVGSSGSPVALTATTPSSPSNFAFSTAFFGDPAAGGDYQGCRIQPHSITQWPFWWAGPRDAILRYRGEWPGKRLSRQSERDRHWYRTQRRLRGSSKNLVENTNVTNFYTLYKADANGGCCLDDSKPSAR